MRRICLRVRRRCQIRLRNLPLAGDALVNQRLAVGSQHGDLGLDTGDEALHLRELGIEESADGVLLVAGRLQRRQVAGLDLVKNRESRGRRDARDDVLVNLELVGRMTP
jgi:hypothetical protein